MPDVDSILREVIAELEELGHESLAEQLEAVLDSLPLSALELPIYDELEDE